MPNLLVSNTLKGFMKQGPVYRDADVDMRRFIRPKISKALKGEQVVGKRAALKDYDKIMRTIENAPGIDQIDSQAVQDLDFLEAGSAYQNATEYLKSQIPLRGRQGLMGLEERPPSDTEKAKFLRIVDAVDNPLAMLDKINSGLGTEEIEAVKAIHPRFMQEVGEVLVDELVKKRPKLTRSQENVLGRLFGAEMSQAKEIADNQASFLSEEQAEPEANVNFQGEGAPKTASQAIEFK